MSPRRVMRTGRAHCIEAALFAAAALAYHGRPPYLMDFQTREYDEDHVVAVFEDGGLWGAISKTNHAVLRWRDGVYSSPRELAMSYFHEYTMADGRKTMLAYSEPFDMRQYRLERWLTVEEDMEWFADDIDEAPHSPAAPARCCARCAPLLQLRKILLLVEQKDPRKRNRRYACLLVFDPNPLPKEVQNDADKECEHPQEYCKADPYVDVADAEESVPKSVDHVQYRIKERHCLPKR